MDSRTKRRTKRVARAIRNCATAEAEFRYMQAITIATALYEPGSEDMECAIKAAMKKRDEAIQTAYYICERTPNLSVMSWMEANAKSWPDTEKNIDRAEKIV